MEFLPPKNDFVFKRLFGDEQNTDILLAFLNAVLVDMGEVPIQSLELLNPFLDKESEDDKLAVLDVLARDPNGDLFDIEVQILNQRNMEKRTLFYWAELYTRQLVSGKPYTALHRAVTINILDFAYLPGTQVHSLYQMSERHTHHVLSDDAEIHFIELPKLEQAMSISRTPLAWWGFFLRGIEEDQAEVFRMQDPMMKKAVDVLERLSQDKEARMRYEARQKAIHDEVSRLEDALQEGLAQGEAKSVRRQWTKRFGIPSPEVEAALQSASSAVLEHILDQLIEPTYTVEQARADLGIH